MAAPAVAEESVALTDGQNNGVSVFESPPDPAAAGLFADPVSVDAREISDDFVQDSASVSEDFAVRIIAPAATVAKGDQWVVSGTAAGNPESLMLYVFGPNYYLRKEVPVVSGEFYYKLDIESSMSSNQYFVVLEHPTVNGFGVIEVSNSDKMLQTVDGTASFIVWGTGKLQGSNAADALCKMIEGNTDDTYVKTVFTVEEAWIKINHPGDQIAGSTFTISGTTNLAVNDQILIEVVSSSFCAIDKTSTSTTSGFSQTTRVVKGDGNDNAWSIRVDTTNFKLDEYTIKAFGIEADVISTVNFNLDTGVPVITPDPDPEMELSLFAKTDFSDIHYTDDLYVSGYSSEDTVYLAIVDHMPGISAVPLEEYVLTPDAAGYWNTTIKLIEPLFAENHYYTLYASGVSLSGGVTGTEFPREFFALMPEGGITIKASGDRSYYIGDTIRLFGRNKDTDGVYLFITGPNLLSDGQQLLQLPEQRSASGYGGQTYRDADVPVSDDGTWEYPWDTSNCGLDTGAYSIYATTILTNGKSSSRQGDAVKLSDSEYARISINLKQPYLSAIASRPSVKPGDHLSLKGTATGDPGIINLYIFGPNKFFKDSISVAVNGSYEKELQIPETWEPGEYFLVLHHSMYNGEFDVHTTDGSTGRPFSGDAQDVPGQVVMWIPAYDSYQTPQASFIVWGTGKLQGSNAADALTKMIDSANIDDIYTKLAITVEGPWIRVSDPGDQEAGTVFTVTGITNLDADDPVLVEILLSDESTIVSTQETLVTPGDADHFWSVEVDSTGFATGSYTIRVTGPGDDVTTSAVIQLVAELPSEDDPVSRTTLLSLVPGWNFISVPAFPDPENATVSALFSPVSTDNHRILAYNTEQSAWTPLNETDPVTPLTGIWIYSENPARVACTHTLSPRVPAVKTVYPGWNAVGLSADDNTLAINALAGTAWRTLIPWNLKAADWDPAIINGGYGPHSAYQEMTPGNGYWLYVGETGVLTGLTA